MKLEIFDKDEEINIHFTAINIHFRSRNILSLKIVLHNSKETANFAEGCKDKEGGT